MCFFSLVSSSPWADAFPSNSAVYQSDVTNERNGCYVQCHGARTESLPLTPWPADCHHGCVCEGTFLWLEGRGVYMHFHIYYSASVIDVPSTFIWLKCIKLRLLKYLPGCLQHFLKLKFGIIWPENQIKNILLFG